jgi:prolyl oligopeptidase
VKHFPTCVLGLLFTAAALAQEINVLPAPPTPKRPVTDEYHGTKVTDDYRWLEDRNSPEVQQWIKAQNERTRAYLDSLPQRTAIHKRLEDFVHSVSPSHFDIQYRNGVLFAMKFQPPKNQNLLVTLRDPNEPGSERAIVDPNGMSKTGTLSIDWYVPSLDGKLVAVAMSEGGSEDSTLHIFDVASGKELGDSVPRVNYPTGGGGAAWLPDNSGLFYTRYPQGGERPKEDLNFYQQIYFHKLGTPSSQDEYVIGKEFPRIAETILETSPDGKIVLASVANGDGGEFEYFVRTADGKWTQITHFEDKVVSVIIGPDDALYLLSRQGAPKGKILKLPLSDLNLADAKTIVPEGQYSIEDYGTGAKPESLSLVATATRLYVVEEAGGPEQVDIFDLNGKHIGTLPTPAVSSVEQIVPIAGEGILFQSETYTQPAAWSRYEDGKVTATALKDTSPVNFSDAVVERVFATSKDGTKIPLNILHLKTMKLNGRNPVHLSGYGGFGISLTPYFLGISGRMWLDHGGIYAIANLRGGGEYGEQWHAAGSLTHKQNAFDDFAACAKYLIDKKYTRPGKFGIEGGSNGGLLMGAEITQHPELFAAVVSHVGIYDMLRVELDPNGSFNTTEYGTVKDPEQFKALYAYSPYHHVKPDTPYPAVLFMTGDNDGRVNPAHSRKMTAALQAATISGKPILLRTSSSSGHGFGTALDERINQQSDAFAFFVQQLGMSTPRVIPHRGPARRPARPAAQP